MPQDRKAIIVKEIEYWKSSKLLPEHYCDFLLHLYADPADAGSKGKAEGRWRSGRAIGRNFPIMGVFLGIVILSIISWVVFHFTSFSPAMQMAAAGGAVAAMYGLGAWRRNRNPYVAHAVLGAGSLLLLVLGEWILTGLGQARADEAVLFLAGCSLIWLAAGLALRVGVLHFCGWAGLMLCYGWVIREAWGLDRAPLLEAAWLPVALILGLSAWQLARANRSVAFVLFAVASIAWFVPDIQGAAFSNGPLDVYEALAAVKLALAVVAAALLRKKWTDWVAKS